MPSTHCPAQPHIHKKNTGSLFVDGSGGPDANILPFIIIIMVFNEEINVIADTDVFYLDDIFKQEEYSSLYGKMMDVVHYPISFLNKGVCGNGGTTGMINYAIENDKGLLVLVPNVSIVKSKECDYCDNEDICCVYGGSDKFNPDAQIVIATYDQFPRLLKTLSKTGIKSGTDLFKMKFWAGRTIVVDEYHKLIDDSGYRQICNKMTEMITKVNSPVILMSATSNDDYAKMLRELLPRWIIRKYNVVYKNEYNINTGLQLWEAKKEELKDVIYTMLNSDKNNHICIFYNSVSDIKKIIGQLNDDRIEVLCSAQSQKKVGKYYSDKFNDKKKLHFMTSAYFTGFDIKTEECKCVIVTSNEFDYMTISDRDIKQIIGRFRIKGGDEKHNDNHIWYIKTTPDQKNYMMNQDTYDDVVKDMGVYGDRWIELSDGIEKKHTLIRTRDILDRFEHYSSVDKLVKYLTDYGYSVTKSGEITGFTTIKRKKHLTFKKAKELLYNKIKVDFDAYPDINELEEFMKVKGPDKFMENRTTKTLIHNWYQAYTLANGQNLEKKNPCDVFGIKNFGRYNQGFLYACLEYLGEKPNSDNFTYLMYNFMSSYVIPWKLDNKGKKNNNTWLVITRSPENGNIFDDLRIRNEVKKLPKMGDRVITKKLSFETTNNSKSYARTATINDAIKSGYIPSLAKIDLYDWINEDKANRLPDRKKDKDWQTIKMFYQGKLSEMYKDTDNTYRFIRSEMNLADCLICDIDGGISFSQFKEIYKEWMWIAYPTINNITEDWTKFRVIVPLENTIKLEGEHNLKVLKMLRTMFCPYEDPDHQVYSFINYEDFTKMYGNEGQVYSIPQDFVDCLNMCITTSYDYNDRKFSKTDIVSVDSKSAMSLSEAQALFFNKLADPTEGARHSVLFFIKKSLSPEDRLSFEDWLGKVYPAYLAHWRSHKVK